MNINPLDILLIVFLIITALLGCRNGIIIEFKKTVSLTSSLILSNIIIKQLADKFYFLKSGTDIFYLTTFLVIFVLIILAVSFIIDMIIEESEEFMIDYYANLGLGALIGVVRGMLLIVLILWVTSSPKNPSPLVVATSSEPFKYLRFIATPSILGSET